MRTFSMLRRRYNLGWRLWLIFVNALLWHVYLWRHASTGYQLDRKILSRPDTVPIMFGAWDVPTSESSSDQDESEDGSEWWLHLDDDITIPSRELEHGKAAVRKMPFAHTRGKEILDKWLSRDEKDGAMGKLLSTDKASGKSPFKEEGLRKGQLRKTPLRWAQIRKSAMRDAISRRVHLRERPVRNIEVSKGDPVKKSQLDSPSNQVSYKHEQRDESLSDTPKTGVGMRETLLTDSLEDIQINDASLREEALEAKLAKSGQLLQKQMSRETYMYSMDQDAEKETGAYFRGPPDPHHFNYIHNAAQTCFYGNKTRRGTYLIILVTSAPWHERRRDVIRQTYGRASQWPLLDHRAASTVFLLAGTTGADTQRRIDKESAVFGDIVQEDFQDSYVNLTRKTVMGLKWVTKYCPHAHFTLKIDDDSTINQARMLDVLRVSPRSNFAAGQVLVDALVDRTRTSKFYLSEEYYADKYFPPYFQGAGYIMSTDIASSAYHISLSIPLFPWEDVFVGFCLQKLGIRLRPVEDFVYLEPLRNPFVLYDDGSRLHDYVIFSGLSKTAMRQVWDLCRSPISLNQTTSRHSSLQSKTGVGEESSYDFSMDQMESLQPSLSSASESFYVS